MFKKGVSGNPGGKPKGTRNKLQNDLIEALADDWYLHGDEAITAAREKDPMGYVKAMISLLPKEVAITRPLEDLTDNELAGLADHLRALSSPIAGTERDPDPSLPETAH